MNFMIYRHGHARVLGRAASPSCSAAWARSARWAATPGLNHELDDHALRQGVRPARRKGFFAQGAGYDAAVFALFLFQMVFMDTTATIPTGADGRALEVLSVHDLRLLHRRRSSTRSSATGSGAAAGSPSSAPTSASATATWTSPAPSVVHMHRRRGRARRRHGARAAHRQVRQGRHADRRSPATTSRWPCSARSSSPSAGSASTPAPRLAGTDLRIAVVAANTMLAGAAGASAAMLWMWMAAREARPSHDVQRHAGRPRGHHRALRLRQRRRRRHHRR